jgi:hypothetical protein
MSKTASLDLTTSTSFFARFSARNGDLPRFGL